MSKKQTGRGFVVVTGTSTGIGAATALHLAGNGFHVFAGVRREVDGEALQARTSATLTPLIIDVTDEANDLGRRRCGDNHRRRPWPDRSR